MWVHSTVAPSAAPARIAPPCQADDDRVPQRRVLQDRPQVHGRPAGEVDEPGAGSTGRRRRARARRRAGRRRAPTTVAAELAEPLLGPGHDRCAGSRRPPRSARRAPRSPPDDVEQLGVEVAALGPLRATDQGQRSGHRVSFTLAPVGLFDAETLPAGNFWPDDQAGGDRRVGHHGVGHRGGRRQGGLRGGAPVAQAGDGRRHGGVAREVARPSRSSGASSTTETRTRSSAGSPPPTTSPISPTATWSSSRSSRTSR